MLARQVDALVFIGSVFQEPIDIKSLDNIVSDVPVFVINGYIPSDNTYCIVSDEVSVMKSIILDMHGQGIERILYIYDTLSYSGNRKLKGYKSGLSECGLTYSDALTLCVKRDLDSAQSQIEDLISSGTAFDAIIASEDLFAIAAQKSMRSFELEVPVVSFNNSILADCANPRLTSIDFMLDTMCSTVINLIFDLIAGKRIPTKVVITPVIVERDTFKPSFKHYC